MTISLIAYKHILFTLLISYELMHLSYLETCLFVCVSVTTVKLCLYGCLRKLEHTIKIMFTGILLHHLNHCIIWVFSIFVFMCCMIILYGAL